MPDKLRVSGAISREGVCSTSPFRHLLRSSSSETAEKIMIEALDPRLSWDTQAKFWPADVVETDLGTACE